MSVYFESSPTYQITQRLDISVFDQPKIILRDTNTIFSTVVFNCEMKNESPSQSITVSCNLPNVRPKPDFAHMQTIFSQNTINGLIWIPEYPCINYPQDDEMGECAEEIRIQPPSYTEEKITELNAQIARIETNLLEMCLEKQNLSAQYEILEKNFQLQNEELNNKNSEILGIKRKYSQLEAQQSENDREIKRLKTENEKLTANNDDLLTKCRNAMIKNIKLVGINTNLEDKNKDLEVKYAALENTNKAASATLKLIHANAAKFSKK